MVSQPDTVDAHGPPSPAPNPPCAAGGFVPAVIVLERICAVKSELKRPTPGEARFAREPSLRTEAEGRAVRPGTYLR